jgi:hypothetical protein
LAQSVGINTDGSAPTAGYLLDVKGQTIIQNNLHISGNVGIGTSTPSVALDVNGAVVAGNTKMGSGRNGDGTFSLTNNGWGRLEGTSGLAIWGDGNAYNNDSPQMLLNSSGLVGIGTTSPVAKLHVEGSNWNSYGGFTYYANGTQGGPCCGGEALEVSIHASKRVLASEFDAFSDARIKNIIGISDSKKDLQTIMALKITDYRMKDAMKDDKPYKKVIAQEVKEVYPQAVSFTKEIIPDIYTMSTLKNGLVTIQNTLKKGDKVKLIMEDKEGLYDVIEATENNFRINENLTGDVFVYGRRVDDFHTVDYEALNTLNISATQELYKIIQAQKEEIESLKKENGVLKASVESNKADLDLIKTTLNLVGQK